MTWTRVGYQLPPVEQWVCLCGPGRGYVPIVGRRLLHGWETNAGVPLTVSYLDEMFWTPITFPPCEWDTSGWAGMVSRVVVRR